MNAVERRSGEWVLLFGVEIIAPDGWDRSNFNQSWFEPITELEFRKRLARSTVRWLS